MLNWLFQHDYLDTYCFERLICMCFVFCICTCSAQLSMFHMERRFRNTLIIIIIIKVALNIYALWVKVPHPSLVLFIEICIFVDYFMARSLTKIAKHQSNQRIDSPTIHPISQPKSQATNQTKNRPAIKPHQPKSQPTKPVSQAVTYLHFLL